MFSSWNFSKSGSFIFGLKTFFTFFINTTHFTKPFQIFENILFLSRIQFCFRKISEKGHKISHPYHRFDVAKNCNMFQSMLRS